MLLKENFYIGNYPMSKYYSDRGFKIKCVETGEEYDEAIDNIGSCFTYEEIVECYTSVVEQELTKEGQYFADGYKIPSPAFDNGQVY